MKEYQLVEGGVTAARGFKASAVAAGIKYADRDDLALVVSLCPASVAGVFTQNKVAAAPVKLDRERVGVARGVVINAGNANACTGDEGLANARTMCAAAEKALGLDDGEMLVCSTGVIGVQLPMAKIQSGIEAAARELRPDAGAKVARAIMTTDTVPKEAAVRVEAGGKTITIGGMCKGAGMIEPNMATMLGFVTTDAAVAFDDLQALLKSCADRSFNRVSIDGDQSTNDTLLVFANGAAGGETLSPSHADWETFARALENVCVSLARQIVADGEGATKLVTVNVAGAASDGDARRVTRAICNSALAKTAFFGCDPNWGRIICATGYSGAEVDELKTAISFDGEWAYRKGEVATPEQLKRLEAVMRQKEFAVNVDLGLGDGCDTAFTCDFSYDYVRINAEYTT